MLAPTILFDHPTLESLASFLSDKLASNGVAEALPHEGEQPVAAQVPILNTREEQKITITAWNFSIAGGITTPSELRSLSMRALAVNTDVPLARWATPTPGAKPSAAYGSFMSAEQLSLDHGAFGISLAEARSMDPQQSLVLSVGYGALCQGANFNQTESEIGRNSFTNSNIGVFVGVEASGLSVLNHNSSVFSASGGALSVTAGRLSFSLGLVGPCYSIDAACASSLAALHACVTTLKNGAECEDAVSIGTKVLSEAMNYATSVAGMTSARGRCHTFDQRADGYSRGEGCCAFLLRAE